MKHRIFISLGCAVLVAVPASTFLPGCGGGSSGTPSPTSTPNPTATANPTSSGTPSPTSSPTPPGSPTPTPTTISTGNNRVENIRFSNLSGLNAQVTAPFSATLSRNTLFKNDGSGFVGTAFFQTRVNGITRKLTFEGPLRGTPVSAGEVFNVGGGTGQALAHIFYSEVSSNNIERSWAAQSGTYTIESGDTNKVFFALSNVRFAPAFNPNGATGNFTLTGRGSVGR